MCSSARSKRKYEKFVIIKLEFHGGDSIKKYLLIYSECDNYAAVTIHAENEYDVLIKAYSFIGENYRLTSNEMRILFNNSDFQRACEIFNNISGTNLVWLSEVQNSLVDKLDSIIEFPGKTINCSTCKNNVECPSPHTCDVCTSLDHEMYCMWEAKE